MNDECEDCGDELTGQETGEDGLCQSCHECRSDLPEDFEEASE